MPKGNIYLVPTVLHEEALHTIPNYVHEITEAIEIFFVEDERTARRYLRKSGYKKSFDEIIMLRIDEQNISECLHYLLQGKDVAILSEAGVPTVADPGADIVKLAHQSDIRVIPLIGPSSILLALMASGFNGQQFSFKGYLPIKSVDRKAAIKQLEQKLLQTGETQIFIETPYRNNALIEDVIEVCNKNTLFCIAANLTGPNEYVKTKSIAEWKQQKPHLEKIPAIFLLGN